MGKASREKRKKRDLQTISIGEVSDDLPHAAPTAWERVLSFAEHGTVLTSVGLIGSVGGLYYRPILYFCVVLFLLGLHRSSAIADCSRKFQAICYLLVFVAASAAMFILGNQMDKHKIAPGSVVPVEPSASPDDPVGAGIATWRRQYDPDSLTLHDLFATDINGSLRGNASYPVNTPQKIYEYSVVTDVFSNSKVVLFFIPDNQETKSISIYLSGQVANILSHHPKDLDLALKYPGESGQLSTAKATFTGRVYLYHETYLEPADVVDVTAAFSKQGVNAILRDVDYLTDQKVQLKLNNRERK